PGWTRSWSRIPDRQPRQPKPTPPSPPRRCGGSPAASSTPFPQCPAVGSAQARRGERRARNEERTGAVRALSLPVRGVLPHPELGGLAVGECVLSFSAHSLGSTGQGPPGIEDGGVATGGFTEINIFGDNPLILDSPLKLCGQKFSNLLYMAVLVGTDQDFYSLLGVSKTASSREIRQAFKKLALKLHPDKNPNNPNAHGDFLKINRAYEVLKDEDLRKKYDKYGEKGLEDNQGGQYESWNYYRYDFGIYDDDPEIITLERREFDAAVNSGEVWFVNFYSSGCSHCHDLAPTWRDFAREVDGLLRIGAVNCGDDRMLCRMKGVNSYPSLLIFRSGMAAVKYYGDRSKESLVSFAMQHIRSTVSELSTGNFVNSIQTAFAAGIGWLITFCSKGGDCLTSQTRLRLSGML
ncbi:Hypothetical predicted protein, partial [Marmota monax]